MAMASEVKYGAGKMEWFTSEDPVKYCAEYDARFNAWDIYVTVRHLNKVYSERFIGDQYQVSRRVAQIHESVYHDLRQCGIVWTTEKEK